MVLLCVPGVVVLFFSVGATVAGAVVGVVSATVGEVVASVVAEVVAVVVAVVLVVGAGVMLDEPTPDLFLQPHNRPAQRITVRIARFVNFIFASIILLRSKEVYPDL